MKKIKQQKAIHYDPKSDVLYLGIKPGDEEEYREISPGINVELDKNSQVIGIEVLNASRVFESFLKTAVRKRSHEQILQSVSRY